MKKNKPSVLRICKVCGKEFRARQREVDCGKAKFCSAKCWVEHKSTNNALVQLVCETCGKSFQLYQSQANSSRRFCSQKCSGASTQNKVTCKCKRCGKEFAICPSAVGAGHGIFCSRDCSSKGQGHKKRPPAKPFVCQTCGKVFLEELGRERKYCSNKCATDSLRKPNGQKAAKRGKDYGKWALAVLRRDKRCVRCGTTEKLQAHHVKHWKKHPESRYDIDNGATLCVYCHHAQHPKIPLEKFISLGGVSLRYCVFCENPFVARRKNQRTCSRKCANRLRRQEEASAMQRRPA